MLILFVWLLTMSSHRDALLSEGDEQMTKETSVAEAQLQNVLRSNYRRE